MIAILLDQLFAHPWIAVAVLAFVLVVLLLPTDVERAGKRGRVKSEVYDLRYGSGWFHLSIAGLRRLQRALLDVMGAAHALFGAATSLLRPSVVRSLAELLRHLANELRRRLGL